MIQKSIRILLLVVVFFGSVMPQFAFALEQTQPSFSSSEGEKQKSTVEWIADELKRQTAETFEKKQVPQFTQEEIAQLEWDQLPVEDVQNLYGSADRNTLQIAAYFYSNLERFLSDAEVKEMYGWSDREVLKKTGELTDDQFAALSRYTPAIAAIYRDATAESKQNLRTKAAELTALPDDVQYTQKDQKWNYEAKHALDPVDNLYKTANLTEVDLVLEGKHGLDFVLERRYNSMNSQVLYPGYGDGSNRAYSDVSPHGDVVFAAGWTFNLPSFSYTTYDITTRYENGTGSERYSRTGERFDNWRKFFISLDDGSTYTNADGWRNYVYDGIRFQGYQHSATLTKDGITYSYQYDPFQSTTITKTNPQGDRITYYIPASNSRDIEITDSVGRLILLKKNGPYGSISDVEVYADKTKQQLLKRIQYELTAYTFGSSSSNRYIQLESVTEISPDNESKVVARYQYHDPSVKGRAEFNYEADYELPKIDGIVDINGIESQTYINRDNQKRDEMRYLLLNQAEYPVHGLKVNYRYSTYNRTANMLERGVVRLYQDDYAITYVSYHPVTSVTYSYLPMSPNPLGTSLAETSYSTDYVMLSPEIWKSSQSEIPRLANVEGRNGDTVVSKTLPNGRPGYEEEVSYKLNPSKIHVLSLVKQTGEEAATTIHDGNKQYIYVPTTYTSYKYTGNHTKPAYVYTFADPQGTAVNRQVYDYLLHVTEQKPADSDIRKYANYVYRTYNNYGDVTLEQDTQGNQKSWVYYVYNNQVAPDLRLLTNETAQAYNDSAHSRTATYTYNSDYLLSSETIVDTYPGRTATDKVVRTYTYKDKLLSSILEETYGAEQKTSVHTINSYDPYGLYPTSLTLSARLAYGQTETPVTVTYQYDRLGQLLRQGYPDGSHAEYAYDVLGRLIQDRFVGKNGDVREVAYSYDDAKRKVTKRLPDGSQLVTVYTPFGDTEYQAQIGTNGIERALVFNQYMSDGMYLQASYPFALPERKTTYVYNANGTLYAQTDPIGTTYFGRANVSKDGTSYLPEQATVALQPNGLEQYAFADRYGNQVKTIAKTGDGSQETTTTFRYDGFGYPLEKRETSSSGQTRRWEYQYDLRGQLLYVMDPELNVYRYEYDSLGNLVHVRENNTLTTRYRYNALSWKLQEEYLPSGEKETFTYDVNGNLQQYTDKAGNRHEYTYTPFYDLASIVSKNVSGSVVNTETWEYVANTSLVSRQTNSNGPGTSSRQEQRFAYDPFHRLASQQVFGRTYQFVHKDRDGQIDELVYPDGTKVSYSYDQAGRLKTVTSPLTGSIAMNYRTDQTGETLTVTYPNGLAHEKRTNSFGQAIRVEHRKGGSAVWNETNRYDLGNLISSTKNGVTATYTYDKIDRLRAEQHPTESKRYTYDNRGNRNSYEGILPQDAGNLAYTFDERNRLRKVQNQTVGNQLDYLYFADGLRASKKENGQETKYVYYNGVVIEELDASNRVKAQNVWGNHLLFRKDAATNKQGYYSFNSHGDVVSVTDSAGNALNRYEYDSWGNPTLQVEGMSNPFLYSGEMYDKSVGLYYLRARYYDPVVGRFISEDTYKGQVDNPLSLNRYTYTHNNPLRFVDPTGYWSTEVTANWTINEMKWQYQKASTDAERSYWASQAEALRDRMRADGYAESDIMQSGDYALPEEFVNQLAWASVNYQIENDPTGFGFYVKDL
ncbi:RHS repeat domain-containing protein [Brevibacillus sp. TJ4]|uniref:RHS repeat domain-containing protein n=1 Tax=Brevibacillus sp. TJ4 TaxID=3234853 RepID=UPI003BA2E4B9